MEVPRPLDRLHVAYYTFLLKAYSYGDLSHTYPIARGLGPLLVALVSGRLIGEHLRDAGHGGRGAAERRPGGARLAAQRRWSAARRPSWPGHAVRRADRLYASRPTSSPTAWACAPPARPSISDLAYIAWLCVLEGPWLLVLALIALRPRTGVVAPARNWWRGVIGGVIANTGYGIAIYALVLGPMAHVAALRETSVLFGALMGTLLLGEPFGRAGWSRPR